MIIDCSNVLNYVAEVKRLCKTQYNKYGSCSSCPMADLGCDVVGEITQEHIDVMQKWSVEHPPETRAERFFKMFPNAPKSYLSTIPITCVKYLGWVKECELGYGTENCKKCWNEPYVERGEDSESKN